MPDVINPVTGQLERRPPLGVAQGGGANQGGFNFNRFSGALDAAVLPTLNQINQVQGGQDIGFTPPQTQVAPVTNQAPVGFTGIPTPVGNTASGFAESLTTQGFSGLNTPVEGNPNLNSPLNIGAQVPAQVPLDTRGFEDALGFNLDTSANNNITQFQATNALDPNAANLGDAAFLEASGTALNTPTGASLTAGEFTPTTQGAGFNFGDVTTGLNALGSVANVFFGFRNLNLQQDQLAFQRDSFNRQFDQQLQLIDEARTRRSNNVAAFAR